MIDVILGMVTALEALWVPAFALGLMFVLAYVGVAAWDAWQAHFHPDYRDLVERARRRPVPPSEDGAA